MTTDLAIPEPAGVPEQLAQSLTALVETLPEKLAEIEDVNVLLDGIARAQALEQYLRRQTDAGPARAIQRLGEIRIGELLGPPVRTGRPKAGSLPRKEDFLIDVTTRNRFRRMARNRDFVLNHLTESRASIIRQLSDLEREAAVAEILQTGPDKSRAAIAQRREDIRTLAESGHTAEQIAEKVGMTTETVRNVCNHLGIKHAGQIIGTTRKLNPNRLAEETVTTLEGAAIAVRLVDFDGLDPSQIEGWVVSLTESLSELNRFKTRLMKETTQ